MATIKSYKADYSSNSPSSERKIKREDLRSCLPLYLWIQSCSQQIVPKKNTNNPYFFKIQGKNIFPASRTWSDQEYCFSPWTMNQSIAGLPPTLRPSLFSRVSQTACWCLFILLAGERHCGSKVFCARTQHSDPARFRTQTTWFGIRRAHRQATEFSNPPIPTHNCRVLCAKITNNF